MKVNQSNVPFSPIQSDTLDISSQGIQSNPLQQSREMKENLFSTGMGVASPFDGVVPPTASAIPSTQPAQTVTSILLNPTPASPHQEDITRLETSFQRISEALLPGNTMDTGALLRGGGPSLPSDKAELENKQAELGMLLHGRDSDVVSDQDFSAFRNKTLSRIYPLLQKEQAGGLDEKEQLSLHVLNVLANELGGGPPLEGGVFGDVEVIKSTIQDRQQIMAVAMMDPGSFTLMNNEISFLNQLVALYDHQ